MEMIVASATLLASAFVLVTLVFWQCSLPNNKLSRRGCPVQWDRDWVDAAHLKIAVPAVIENEKAASEALSTIPTESPAHTEVEHERPPAFAA
ncbi:hypothetical protein [Methylobacterium gnaphalii]|uniref:Uncharacterized protein n=1 Tax=Methylobacterium gnaphalii TaxID=1010610 RepID=A0A512JNY7_9HYPH|nr:hypothetical protein [Methylobacterium gnaphalii]GEP11674.1 hypothetical protein MGN01_35190 [Methylobacterium gnaphalii]GJD71350.1 hypothetical protein MMMDOFMJ_4306 [Methylobacterium gnaphalii]GLS50172.1 hypothetical protein GCM10007885_30240 [Methylobacterium gnaphalii]